MWAHDSKRGQGATLWCGASRGQELMIFRHILTHPDPNTKALGPILEPSWESSEQGSIMLKNYKQRRRRHLEAKTQKQKAEAHSKARILSR